MLRFVAAGVVFSTLGSACLFVGDDDGPESPVNSDECAIDGDCQHLAKNDPCYAQPVCNQQRSCEVEFLLDDDACQCEYAGQCEGLGFLETDCNVVSCSDDHQCSEELVPAGPSPFDAEGDCTSVTCDGESPDGNSMEDADDLPNDNNECTADICEPDGPQHNAFDDGSACRSDGVCYGGQCFDGCQPEDPDACGDEGPNEPSNNDGFAATSVNEFQESCGMLDGEDVDWFEVYIVDEDLEMDIIEIDVMSSAATVEICAFVNCESGTASGCSNIQSGPNGSSGCCWQGDPNELAPTWDLDCSGTSDDSGTLFYSVRAPGGGACETYRISAHY